MSNEIIPFVVAEDIETAREKITELEQEIKYHQSVEIALWNLADREDIRAEVEAVILSGEAR